MEQLNKKVCTMKKRKQRKRSIIVLFFVSTILIGVAMRIAKWNASPYLSRDSVYYIEKITIFNKGGHQLYLNTLDKKYYPPMHLYLASLLMKFGIGSLEAGISLNILLGACIPIIIFYISKTIINDTRIALMSLIITMFHPSIMNLSLEIQRDTGFIFFNSLSIMSILAGCKTHKMFDFICGGLFTAFGVMFRIENIELLIFMPIVLFISYKIKSKKNKFLLSKLIKNGFWYLTSSLFFLILLFVMVGIRFIDLPAILQYYITRIQ